MKTSALTTASNAKKQGKALWCNCETGSSPRVWDNGPREPRENHWPTLTIRKLPGIPRHARQKQARVREHHGARRPRAGFSISDLNLQPEAARRQIKKISTCSKREHDQKQNYFSLWHVITRILRPTWELSRKSNPDTSRKRCRCKTLLGHFSIFFNTTQMTLSSRGKQMSTS